MKIKKPFNNGGKARDGSFSLKNQVIHIQIAVRLNAVLLVNSCSKFGHCKHSDIYPIYTYL
jgi:hypothetical protein